MFTDEWLWLVGDNLEQLHISIADMEEETRAEHTATAENNDDYNDTFADHKHDPATVAREDNTKDTNLEF